ncbi:MAG TPA: MBL fold metallo-hydrolase [Rhodocyclaceae bacterium]|nr:MBL fold metallo-hydrolase [Rhodocyclaceae bacterium]HMV52999.1 MBL fold metallo-hydrolase [Rhodocyclaceae bacterium]HNA02364.1 MBL fold metallo-hydrolase [Rhodocyclaceae bacterium]HNB79271.1 MBL fold metallo-hydrolase [Rhodocyclaceae bacterium]HNC61404.1 MBL fold metallo-hydrolase [Rhodocyclaceae bacterium]
MRIRFLGAAGEVTGSCFLVEYGELRFLVDCGLFQGGRNADLKNLRALDFGEGFGVKQIAFVLLTHAHLDHCGLLPRLAALGFKGPIHATHATVDLAKVILIDSAHIQEKEAEWLNRHRHARHARRGYDEAPLYTVAQAQATLRQFRGVGYDQAFEPAPGVRVVMRDAGHILGSAIVEVELGEGAAMRRLVFSGDLGQPGRPVLRDATPVAHADLLVVESTYGNRLHRPLDATLDELVVALERTLKGARGNVVIPSFAVGRTQELLFVLTRLTREGRLHGLNVHVDSPMALAATEVTLRHPELLDGEAHELMAWQKGHPKDPRIHFVQDVEESMALNTVRGGAIVISASGMCEAGRIKYHLLHNLPRPECAIVIVGFQAAGTLGRRLVDGARRVTLFGKSVQVRATIHTIGGLSAHADQAALLGWLRGFRHPPRQTFVVHGELETAQYFAGKIRDDLGWTRVDVPAQGDQANIETRNME